MSDVSFVNETVDRVAELLNEHHASQRMNPFLWR